VQQSARDITAKVVSFEAPPEGREEERMGLKKWMN
jgi:hypothetical protein